MSTIAHLNVFPLGSYYVFIDMDWIEKHRSKGDYFNKVVECIDGKRMPTKIRGILQPILVRNISSLQLQRFFKKGYQVYVVHILDPTEVKGMRLEDYKVLKEYANVFPYEVPGLPLKREIEFTIDIVPGVAPFCKVPYKMSTPKLIDLKMQLHELLYKKYIRLSVSAKGHQCRSSRRMII